MHVRSTGLKTLCALVVLLGWTASAAAQVARVSGLVRDEAGQPIKGATIRADNPEAALASLTAATDEKGRFAIIGLARGEWSFTAQAPGFQAQFNELNIVRTGTPLPPLVFTLQKAIVRPPAGVEGITAKDLQQQLESADALFKQQKFDEAIGVYRSVLRGAPSLAIIHLQIGAAYRNAKEYDKAIVAYNDLLKVEPENGKAQVGLAMATLEKGDTAGAEQILNSASASASPGRDVYFGLAEIKRGRNQIDDAMALYQKASASDASWGKPLYRLGTLAVDPTSPEAAQARTALDQMKR
jgi:tetratricopeptide (TPR) repeat protein